MLTMLRPLPHKAELLCASLLAHAVLFRGLHERIPITTVYTHAAENIRDRRLSPVVESCELNAHLTNRDRANLSTLERSSCDAASRRELCLIEVRLL